MKGDINPAIAQRKKDKAAQVKKSKANQAAQRNERLTKINPIYLERKIKELEDKNVINKLSNFEEKRLQSLKKDLLDIQKSKSQPHTKEIFTSNDNSTTPGKKSIYWDPLLNPSGNPPKGHSFKPRPWFSQDDENVNTQPPSNPDLLKIPYPKGPPLPIGIKNNIIPAINSTPQTTYESAPVLRNLIKESSTLIPSSVQKKRKIEPTSSHQVTLEEVNDSD